jgi:hypothetical protein
MTPQFTDILQRQLQGLGQRLQHPLGETQNVLTNETGVEFSLSPQQMLEIAAGNSAWMQQFEQNLEQRFAQLGDRITDRWLNTTDRELRKSITEIATLLQDLVGNSASPTVSPSDADFESSLGRGQQQLSRSLGKMAGNFLQHLLTQTRTSQSETSRSQDESSHYRLSRGQTQAELSQELARGKRYR